MHIHLIKILLKFIIYHNLYHGVLPTNNDILFGYEKPIVALKASKIPLIYNLTFLSYLDKAMWFHLLFNSFAFESNTSPSGCSIISVVVNMIFKPLILIK